MKTLFTFLVEDLNTFTEAIDSSDAPFWKETINNEISSIIENYTLNLTDLSPSCNLTDLSPSCKPIGCKWIFKKKMRHDGSIEKYKARLLAKDYTQKKVWLFWYVFPYY